MKLTMEIAYEGKTRMRFDVGTDEDRAKRLKIFLGNRNPKLTFTLVTEDGEITNG